jgi:hypothetical protein
MEEVALSGEGGVGILPLTITVFIMTALNMHSKFGVQGGTEV